MESVFQLIVLSTSPNNFTVNVLSLATVLFVSGCCSFCKIIKAHCYNFICCNLSCFVKRSVTNIWNCSYKSISYVILKPNINSCYSWDRWDIAITLPALRDPYFFTNYITCHIGLISASASVTPTSLRYYPTCFVITSKIVLLQKKKGTLFSPMTTQNTYIICKILC